MFSMKRFLPLTLVLLLFSLKTQAQLPPPCGAAGDDPPGCFMCNTVYAGSNANMSPGNTPGNFCGVIHNNLWLSFMACSSTISFTVLLTGCTLGQGLQVLVTDANLQPVSNCCTPPPNMINCNVTATGLIAGELYYVMIDGASGDVCNFVLTATGGFCFGPPDPPGPITANPAGSPVCPNTPITYSIPPVQNAATYTWNLPPGATIIDGAGTNMITVVYNSAPIAGVICVTPSNPCHNGVPTCLPILVQNKPPIFYPPAFFCEEDYPVTIDGNTFSRAGVYRFSYTTPGGCDSVVNYNILTHPQAPGFIDTSICLGNCVIVHNQTFCNPGIFTVTLPDASMNGCDSIIRVNVAQLIPIAEIAAPPQLPCAPGSTIQLDGSNSSSNGMYSWLASGGGNIVSGGNTLTPVVNAAGTYILTVTVTNMDGLSCSAMDTVQVFPQLLPLDTIRFTAAPTQVCAGATPTYTIAPVAGATNYNWTVTPGATVNGTGTSITVNWGNLSSGTLCVTATNACGASPQKCVNVTIFPIPTADFTVTSPICISDTSTIVYTGNASSNANFTWNFNGGLPAAVTGPGPHRIYWTTAGAKTVTLTVSENGCTSSQGSQTVQVDNVLSAPVINCVTTTTSIDFSWDPVPGASGYTVTINAGSPQMQTDTFYNVSGLAPNESVTITVSANGNTACGASTAMQTCQAQNCPTVNLTIDPVADICGDLNPGTIQLTFSQNGGAGNGTITWSGPGVTPSGLFDPAQANIGSNTITLAYVEGTCSYSEAIVINVYEAPTADFSAESPICQNNSATIQYTGNASGGAVFNWDFGGGNIQSGSGSGPYEIIWNTAGSQTVSLVVTENGCASPAFTQTVAVDAPLDAPVIQCSATTNSVTFTWDPVAGATSYDVNVISGSAGVLNGNSYVVDNLSPGEEVVIAVIVNGNSACGVSQTQASCITDNCPQVDVVIDSIAPVCKDGNAAPVNLTAVVSGGSGNGQFSWSGPGVSNGVFNPNAPTVNPPSVNIRVIYTEGNCSYDSIRMVTVNSQPDPSFSVDARICRTGTSTITYTGNASNAAVFDWDFGGGTIMNGATGAGPYEISWTTGGTKTVSLVVTDSDCPSTVESQTIEVDNPLGAPVISCDPTTTQIEFAWASINNASDYTVNVLTGQSGTLNGTNYTVTGLMPNDEVTIEVIANGPTVCGPSRDTITCFAKECPAINLLIRQVNDICLYANLGPLDLSDSLIVIGSNMPTNVTWNGDPGTNYLTPEGLFFPYDANHGDNLVEVVWEEEGCVYTTSINVRVFPIPVSGFLGTTRVCVNDDASFNAFSVSATATYDWDFGNGVVQSGSGPGPYNVRWSAPGRDSIILVLEENGCISDPTTGYIQIDQPLAPPTINCSPSTTALSFTWDPVAGANDYEITIVSQPPAVTVTQQNDFGITFSNLMQNDQVTISVAVRDTFSPCPATVVTETCIAKDCPPITISIDPLPTNCLTPGTPLSIQLNAVIQNGTGTGIGVWSGDQVNSLGVFTPSQPGAYSVTYRYEEDSCPFSGSATFNLYAIPTPNFSANQDICITNASTIVYTGTPVPNAVYQWNFSGGTPAVVAGPGPHQIRWNQSGSYNVSLNVTANGCSSTTQTLVVNVDDPIAPPIINCTTTPSSVEFCWDADPLVSNYSVVVLTGQSGARLGNCYRFENLAPLTDVSIALTANGSSACGPVTVNATCTSEDCPVVNVTLDPLDLICLYPNAPTSINLADSLTITPAGNGVVAWAGNGISNNGIFNPVTAGEGTHIITVTYVDNFCRYEDNITVFVSEPPVADAGADQIITCTDIVAPLGGPLNANNCSCAVYAWSGGTVTDPSAWETSTTSAGTFTLTVVDTETGCTDTDDVVVDLNQDPPVLDASVENVSCFGRNDGAITVNGVQSGTPPFQFRFNGGALTDQRLFSNLGAGTYEVEVIDANGCTDAITFTISEPQELSVEIVIVADNDPIILGDSIRLNAITNYAPELLNSIQWTPLEQFPNCDEVNITNCLSAVVQPNGTTIYTVRVENLNGCVALDDTTVAVRKIHPVFIPSAFSPNDQDNINDVFQIFSGPQVARIKSFLVFDRWGTTVHEYYDFAPDNPAHGWNGFYRGKRMNSAVFVYFAEIEFKDGLVEIFKGDVTLK